MTTIFGIPANVVYATAGVYALLIVASAIVWMLMRAATRPATTAS